ncbi:MAG: apolipoprotein N-acyltransferase, partial [Alistipes sp.]|nr:apolipoprotein N-acyltransferase [Alistipes sp.]
MLVMSNDGWWGNTPGHKRLFDFCRLRAIETRRAVARSANTGVSGFISSRGDVEQRLDWDQRGLLQQEVEVRHDKTIYSTYGDWVGRMSLLISFLTLLYYSAYRVRRKNHLVD